MKDNIFGNLKDWGIVLEKLEAISKNGKLNNYQEDLIRLLRFNNNWRLREAAIESLAAVEVPGSGLFREVFSLVMRNDLYYDVRILAADGLEKLTANIVRGKTFDGGRLKEILVEILEGMEDLLASSESPKFHNAIRRSRERIRIIEAEI